MNYTQLNHWLHTENSVNIQMPNEIYEDLMDAEFKTWKHRCFAYSLYYLSSYLYRNAIFGNAHNAQYGVNKLAELFSPNPKPLSYIYKKGGILDSIGYTDSITDYPISFYMDEQILEFSTLSELDQSIKRNYPRFMVKKPIKSFYRDSADDTLTGTFYDFQNTHLIPIEKFISIISDSTLGFVPFYIYSYLKMMNDKFPMGYQVSNKRLAEIVGCNEETVSKYTNNLELSEHIVSERKLIGYKLLEKIYITK